MGKPANLPENLVAIRDKAIDYAFGRTNSEPKDLQRLYEWLEVDGWDELVGPEAEEDFAVAIDWVAEQHFNDEELESWEGLDPTDIDDALRVKFARDRLDNVFDEDEWSVLSICGALLENESGDSAYICASLTSEGQGGMKADWDGVFKTFADFQETIRNSESLVLMDDCPNLSNDQILRLWKK
jgi:hypothetical protein